VSVARAGARFGAASLEARPSVPAHVVYKSFAHETVVLDLQTALYHGLNPVAGRMLEALDEEETIRAALRRLVVDFVDAREADIERDLLAFCADLHERGLIEVSSSGRPG
jgi:hypothetical protein